MKKNLIKITTHLQAFMLGTYFISEFRFNTPVEWYKWLLSGFFLLFFTLLPMDEDDK